MVILFDLNYEIMNLMYNCIFSKFIEETRSALINLCLKDVNLASTLDINLISDNLKGYTGSDISNVCRLVLYLKINSRFSVINVILILIFLLFTEMQQ